MDTPEKATEIKGAIAAVIAFLTALWGWLGWAILVWFVCLMLDYLSGTAAARRAGEWSSEIARDGLWHKLGEIFAVVVASLCDIALGVILAMSPVRLPFEIGPLLTPLVLLWYIITELGSITENAGKLGAPLPSWLKKTLKQYKDILDTSQDKQAADAEAPTDPWADFNPPDDAGEINMQQAVHGKHEAPRSSDE